jgi:hypothetical protein
VGALALLADLFLISAEAALAEGRRGVVAGADGLGHGHNLCGEV